MNRTEVLDEALTAIHLIAHLAHQRTGDETLRQITEVAWSALTYDEPPPRLSDCPYAVCSCSVGAMPQCPRATA